METFCKIANGIEYKKCPLDADIIELLGKLEQHRFPLNSVCNEIKSKRADVLKVSYDEKLYGILVVRGVIDHTNDLCLEIDHAIANDHIEEHFSSILAESLFAFVANEKYNGQSFVRIRQHAHNPGLCRMLASHYGKPSEWIFTKDVRELKCV